MRWHNKAGSDTVLFIIFWVTAIFSHSLGILQLLFPMLVWVITSACTLRRTCEMDSFTQKARKRKERFQFGLTLNVDVVSPAVSSLTVCARLPPPVTACTKAFRWLKAAQRRCPFDCLCSQSAFEAFLPATQQAQKESASRKMTICRYSKYLFKPNRQSDSVPSSHLLFQIFLAYFIFCPRVSQIPLWMLHLLSQDESK